MTVFKALQRVVPSGFFGLCACVSSHAGGIEFAGPSTLGSVSSVYDVRVNTESNVGWDEFLFSKQDSRTAFGGNAFYGTSTLSYVTSTLAANIDLYDVSEGQTLADSSLAGFASPSLLHGDLLVAHNYRTSASTYFYLGVRVHGDFDGMPGRSSLGWLLLENTQSSGLRLVDSHVAYNVGSVVIGQVPESGTGALALAGCLTLLAGAWRKSQQA